MTESREELSEKGWHQRWVTWEDINLVTKTRCKQVACGGYLTLTTWVKENQHDKQFSQCIRCGHREAFQ